MYFNILPYKYINDVLNKNNLNNNARESVCVSVYARVSMCVCICQCVRGFGVSVFSRVRELTHI